MAQLKKVSAKNIPPTLTAQILNLPVGEALILPINRRYSALAVIRYYRVNKNFEGKYKTRKKNDTEIFLIRTS